MRTLLCKVVSLLFFLFLCHFSSHIDRFSSVLPSPEPPQPDSDMYTETKLTVLLRLWFSDINRNIQLNLNSPNLTFKTFNFNKKIHLKESKLDYNTSTFHMPLPFYVLSREKGASPLVKSLNCHYVYLLVLSVKFFKAELNEKAGICAI